MPRFVILEHDYPVLHWDLMLDAGAALHTWRLASVPRLGVAIEATALPDHRRMYLDYEGPVSGDRGKVRRFEEGTFDELDESAFDVRVLALAGQHVRGTVRLTRIVEDKWRFEWMNDSLIPIPAGEGNTGRPHSP